MRLIFGLLILAIGIAGCTGSRLDQFLSLEEQDPSTVPVIPSATQLLSPTRVPPDSALATLPASSTPFPIPTTTGTPTPLPVDDSEGSLSPEGPWLLGVGYDNNIYALNADGTGFSGVHIPASADPEPDLRFGISKTNGLIALRTRLPGNNMGNYAVYIFKLPNTEPFLTIPLISGPAPQQSAMDLLPAINALGVEGGQPTYIWSPDERYLAFVAALDDVSSDLYVLDIETLDVQRLTDGPNQAVLMGWSPDGRWVVHMEAVFNEPPDEPLYQPFAVWAADREGGPAQFLYATREDAARGTETHTEKLVGWRNDREMVVMERDFLGRLAYLSIVDLDTGSRQLVHDSELEGAAVDPNTGTIAYLPLIAGIHDEPSAPEDPLGGIQLLKAGSTEAVRLNHEPWTASYGGIRWLPELERFSSTRLETIIFTADGIVTEVFDEPEPPMASPDGRWLAFIRKGSEPGIVIFDPSGNHIYEVANTRVGSIVWGPDSDGFYLLPGRLSDFHDIFFFPVPNGEVVHVSGDQDLIDTSLMIAFPSSDGSDG